MVEPNGELSRRKMLTGTALGVGGVAVLAACSSPGGGGEGTTGGTTPSAEPSATGGTGGGGAVLAKLSDVPVGKAIAAKDAEGNEIIIAQPTAGTAVAFSAKCTHKGCTVRPVATSLNCPCHGSKFNALTGAVTTGPAQAPLPAVPVKVADGNVVAG